MKTKKILVSIIFFCHALILLGGFLFIGEMAEEFSAGELTVFAVILLMPGFIVYKSLKYLLRPESKEDLSANKEQEVPKNEIVIDKYPNRILKIDDLKRIGEVNAINPYMDITPFVLDKKNQIVHYSGLLLKEGEVVFYAAPASTFKDKNQVVGYNGSSSGISVRVAKGVSVRTGSHSGTPIRQDVRKFHDGDLVITNKRVVFTGKDDSFDYAIHKISAIRPIDHSSFTIQAGNSFRNIKLNPKITSYAEAYITYSSETYTNKTVSEQELLEPSLQDFYEQVRLEALKIYRSTKKPKHFGCLGTTLLSLSVILALATVVASLG